MLPSPASHRMCKSWSLWCRGFSTSGRMNGTRTMCVMGLSSSGGGRRSWPMWTRGLTCPAPHGGSMGHSSGLGGRSYSTTSWVASTAANMQWTCRCLRHTSSSSRYPSPNTRVHYHCSASTHNHRRLCYWWNSSKVGMQTLDLLLVCIDCLI